MAEDRFRFIPCTLDPRLTSHGPALWITETIDLTNDVHWDFAVRAIYTINYGADSIPESASMAFAFDDEESPEPTTNAASWFFGFARTPEERREALCRVLCNYLDLDIDTTFPPRG